ncbi:unnamed protein product [Ilex paraguariensis]|uniref:TONSOKU protein n=1 Tax=Ilex paraguariensis TaxID=185542 RepID=A0ABC8UDW0_9AQUA
MSKHREFAKRKKRIASELCDKEKLSDSFLVIGESYQKLRNFNKALKWYTKSWETYKSIGNLEGQALGKINIGDVLDSDGNWAGALDAFEEGYRQVSPFLGWISLGNLALNIPVFLHSMEIAARPVNNEKIALQANLPSVQLSALENMHYSHMIRFDNVEEASSFYFAEIKMLLRRRLQSLIDKLKLAKTREPDVQGMVSDCCSETETEGDNQLSNGRSDVSCSPVVSKPLSIRPKSYVREEESKDDVPLVSLLRGKNSVLPKTAGVAKPIISTTGTEASSRSMSRSTGSQTAVGRKRVRLILSDDEGETHVEVPCSRVRVRARPSEDVATSGEFLSRNDPSSPALEFQDVSPVASKCAISGCTPNKDESICSYKNRSSSNLDVHDGKYFRFSNTNEVVDTSNTGANGSKSDADVSGNLLHKKNTSNFSLHACHVEHCQHIIFRIDEDFVHVEMHSCMVGDKLSIEHMKVEVACLYYLQLPAEKRSRGLLPVIQHFTCGGRALESLEVMDSLKDQSREKGWIEVSISGMSLVQLYCILCVDMQI